MRIKTEDGFVDIKKDVAATVVHAFSSGELVVQADVTGEAVLVPSAVAAAAGAYPVSPGARLAVQADGDTATSARVISKSRSVGGL